MGEGGGWWWAFCILKLLLFGLRLVGGVRRIWAKLSKEGQEEGEVLLLFSLTLHRVIEGRRLRRGAGPFKVNWQHLGNQKLVHLLCSAKLFVVATSRLDQGTRAP